MCHLAECSKIVDYYYLASAVPCSTRATYTRSTRTCGSVTWMVDSTLTSIVAVGCCRFFVGLVRMWNYSNRQRDCAHEKLRSTNKTDFCARAIIVTFSRRILFALVTAHFGGEKNAFHPFTVRRLALSRRQSGTLPAAIRTRRDITKTKQQITLTKRSPAFVVYLLCVSTVPFVHSLERCECIVSNSKMLFTRTSLVRRCEISV